MGSDSSKTEKFVRDAEDVVKTVKFIRNISQKLPNNTRRQQSPQSRQPDRHQSNSRGDYIPPCTPQRHSTLSNAPQSQPTLERTRTPYNYTYTDLDNTIRQANGERLYPNLDSVNRNVPPPQHAKSPASVVNSEIQRQNDNANSPSALGARPIIDEEYVVVNQFQQRMHFKPSAPSAADVGFPQTTANFNAIDPTQPRFGASISNPGPSNAAPAIPSNSRARRPRSESRGRASDDSRLNCPTCNRRFGLTIYNCESGHGSCKECKEANKLCGYGTRSCRATITTMRNIALEAYVADLNQNQYTQCENDNCTLRFNIYGMEKHLKECPFGVMDCPMGTFFGKCSYRCKVDQLASHFDDRHRDQRIAEVDKEMFLFNICSDSQKLYFIKNGPYNFLVHVKVSENDRMVYMAVQLLGTAVSASKWTIEFQVYNKRQPRRKFQYIDSCQSIGTPLNEIFAQSKCAVLPVTYAMSFVNESALTYKFYIKKNDTRPRRPNNRNEWKRQNAQN